MWDMLEMQSSPKMDQLLGITLYKEICAKYLSLFKDFQHMTEDSFSFIQDNYISTIYIYIFKFFYENIMLSSNSWEPSYRANR